MFLRTHKDECFRVYLLNSPGALTLRQHFHLNGETRELELTRQTAHNAHQRFLYVLSHIAKTYLIVNSDPVIIEGNSTLTKNTDSDTNENRKKTAKRRSQRHSTFDDHRLAHLPFSTSRVLISSHLACRCDTRAGLS